MSSEKLTTQCKDMSLIYVVYATIISGNYELFIGVKVANVMVSSRLDYCNSLLYCTKGITISGRQRIQNTLCWIVWKLSKSSHVIPFLHKLHWLPIQYCILFKYNLIIYKTTNLSQPPCLSLLIKCSDLTQGISLSVSSTRPNKHIGMLSFAVAAPTE